VNSFFANRVPNTPFPASMVSLPLLAVVDIDNNTTDLAFFGQTRLQLTDKLRVELGALNKESTVIAVLLHSM